MKKYPKLSRKQARYLTAAVFLWGGLFVPISAKSQDNELMLIKSPRFVFDSKTQVITGYDGIEGTQKTIKLTSQKSTYSHKTGELWFKESVILQQDDLKMISQELGTNDKFKSLTAMGDVKGVFSGIQSFSNKAQYFIKDKQVVLSENPKAIQGSDEVRGTILTIDLTRKILISSGKAKIKVSAETLEKSQ